MFVSDGVWPTIAVSFLNLPCEKRAPRRRLSGIPQPTLFKYSTSVVLGEMERNFERADVALFVVKERRGPIVGDCSCDEAGESIPLILRVRLANERMLLIFSMIESAS